MPFHTLNTVLGQVRAQKMLATVPTTLPSKGCAQGTGSSQMAAINNLTVNLKHRGDGHRPRFGCACVFLEVWEELWGRHSGKPVSGSQQPPAASCRPCTLRRPWRGRPGVVRAEHTKIKGEAKVILQQGTQHVQSKRGPHTGGPATGVRTKNHGSQPTMEVFSSVQQRFLITEYP